jgi:hypothetical protein
MCLGFALSMLSPLPGENRGEGDQDEGPSPNEAVVIANAAPSLSPRAGERENDKVVVHDGGLPIPPLFALGLIPQ